MARLLLALAALVAVVAVSSAEDTSMTERQLIEQLLEKLEKRHEDGSHGHTHGPKDTEHHKPMSTKAPMERRWVTRPFPLPEWRHEEGHFSGVTRPMERRHEEGSNGHTHDPKDTEDHKQMATKEPMAIKAPMPTKASKGKEERSEDRLTAVELRELKAVLRALRKHGKEERSEGRLTAVEFLRKHGYNTRQDFDSDRAWGNYLAHTVKIGWRVTADKNFAQKLPGVDAGSLGTVQNIELPEFKIQAPEITVKFDRDNDGGSPTFTTFAWYYNIALKKRQDFDSDRAWGDYLAATVKIGWRVTMDKGFAQRLPGIDAGSLGTVQHIELPEYAFQAPQITVKFDRDNDGGSPTFTEFAYYFNIVGSS